MVAEIVRNKHFCNRLKFLGKILSVERATPASSKDGLFEDGLMKTTAEERTEAAPPPLPPVPQSSETFQTARVASGREPIAPSLGVDYPFPPQLEYVLRLLPHYDINPRSDRACLLSLLRV